MVRCSCSLALVYYKFRNAIYPRYVSDRIFAWVDCKRIFYLCTDFRRFIDCHKKRRNTNIPEKYLATFSIKKIIEARLGNDIYRTNGNSCLDGDYNLSYKFSNRQNNYFTILFKSKGTISMGNVCLWSVGFSIFL